jgi:NTE family protein
MGNHRFTLSLSGGGLSSIAYAGFNDELIEKHLEPSSYAGLSGGALLAVLLASKMTSKEIISFVKNINFLELLNTRFTHFEVIDHTKLIEKIREALPYKTFEQLPVPAVIFASDLTKTEPVAIQGGDLASAIVASCSMFPLLQPVKRQGRLLGDGGFTVYYGARFLRCSTDKIIGVDVTGLSEGVVRGAFHSLFMQINSAVTSNSRYELSEYPVDLDIKISFPTPSIFSFDQKVSHLLSLGRKSAKKHLSKIKGVVKR